MTDTPPTKDPNGLSPITTVFVENESYLKRFIRRFLSRAQDIEDVVQDTYIRARCAEEKTVISSPKSFLFRIARNEALMELRKKSRRITDYIEELDTPEALDGEASVEDQAIAEQRLGIFCQSALEMTPRCRKAFLMCKVYGLSYKEVASQLGISVSGVEKHVAKGFEICNAYVDRMERSGDKQEMQKNRPVANVVASNVVPIDRRESYKEGES
jgi:RNA polymerase sigma factor (sigma-70 family)